MVVFQTFSTSGKGTLSAIDFFKMAKVLKIYPTVVPLETLKRVVMKSPDFWNPQATTSPSLEEGKDFHFNEFVKAIRVSFINWF